MVYIFSQPFITSANLLQAEFRSRRLYYQSLKCIPWLIDSFKLEYSPRHMTKVIRGHFTKYSKLKDLNSIDVMIFKGQNELQEALNVWKVPDEVIHYFKVPPEDTRLKLDKIADGEKVPDWPADPPIYSSARVYKRDVECTYPIWTKLL